MLRLRAMVIACLMLVGLVPLVASAEAVPSAGVPAAGSTAGLRFLEYNICGGSGNCTASIREGDLPRGEVKQRTDKVAEEVRQWSPDAVFLNEVCTIQYKELVTKLGGLGYRGKYEQTTGTSAGCGMQNPDREDTTEGVAVFVKGLVLNPTEPVSDLGDADAERYVLVCADTYLGGRFTKACATHFTANSPAAAQRQAEKARAYTDAWIAADIPVVVSGDTNLLPDSAGMRALYAPPAGTGRFLEVDPTNAPTFDTASTDPAWPPKKLDYVFVSARHFRDPAGSVVGHDERVSDHDVLRGSAAWAPCTPGLSLDPRGACASSVYELVNRNSGKALAVDAGATDRGAPAVQQGRTGARHQQWEIRPNNGAFVLVNRGSGMVLDAAEPPNALGTQLTQWGPNGGLNQQWLVAESGGYATLTNRATGLVADVQDDSVAENAPVIQWNSNAGANQQWLLRSVG